MTVPATATELGARLPNAGEKAAANQLRKILAAKLAAGEEGARLNVIDEGKRLDITLTPALSGLLMDLLRHVGSGNAVTLVPVSQMLTTQQAADILNVSRPFFIKLLEEGQIPFELVGRHRRVKAENLFSYKARRDQKRGEALSALAEMDSELI
ncbi:excisionase family DNA-binding protein [Prosthecodimorpha staleyi]|uniref:Excisionase family DNA-binding protein n=1 Tax=Prosthecodimorpha staleyi TaxID=2840188 RepID=A0A947GEB9_9HYPH|nr:excisionase family DNA-binding protein [Prosthecodimorpha staleyi]MBT9291752.1 excisionase family DNA-binding protein [Prosthecodimorpha staleyi]